MAVFSNDRRIQGQWQKVQDLNQRASRQSKCSPTREVVTDSCIGDPEKRRRLGGAACNNIQTITVKCEDYSGMAAQANAELNKLIAAAAKTKADADKKAADTAAEQAILARRRAADKTLETSYFSACRQYTINEVGFSKPGNPNYDPKKCAELNKERIKGGGAFQSGQKPVTFDEIARELGTSKASGKKPAKLKAKAKAKAKAAAKLKKKNR